MNVGELIEELSKYPKGMAVASFNTSREYGPITVATDGDGQLDEPFEWLVICCDDWLEERDADEGN